MRTSRAGGVGALLCLAALAGCSATAASGPAALPPNGAGATTAPHPTGPAPTWLDPAGTPGLTGTATPTVPPERSSASPLEAYQGLVAAWQRARSRFFATITAGRPLSLADEHELAAGYLAALRTFAAGLRTAQWPPAAGAAVRELLAVNARQQAHLVAMTTAPYPSAFTERLADYGVDAARENRAVTAVTRQLGG